MEKHEPTVQAVKNSAFLCLITTSEAGLGYTDPDVEPLFLPPDVDNETLGHNVRNALSKSKQVSSEEFHRIVNSSIL